MVFYYPNVIGQMWPNIMYLIVYIIFVCAIRWEYTLNKYLVKIYNKTILISDLLLKSLPLNFIGFASKYKILFLIIKPNIVRDYYKVYNQQITKVIIFFVHFYIYTEKKACLIKLIKKVLNINLK